MSFLEILDTLLLKPLQLVFEVVFVLGVKVVAFAEVGEELGENSDLFRILSGAQSNAPIDMGAPVAEFAFFYVGEDFFLGDSEIEDRKSVV